MPSDLASQPAGSLLHRDATGQHAFDFPTDQLTSYPFDTLPLFHQQSADWQNSFVNAQGDTTVDPASFGNGHHPPETSIAPSDGLTHDSGLSDLSFGNGQSSLNGPHNGLFQELQTPRQTAFPRRRSRYRFRNNVPKATPVMIPAWEPSPDPLQRWQDSPPDEEAAPIAAIIDALGNGEGNLPHLDDATPKKTRDARLHRPNSTAGSNTDSVSSGTSQNSSRSNRSASSVDANTSRTRGRRRGRVEKCNGEKPRIFACTFCCDSFKKKYDWARHEKSLHLNLETWTCVPAQGFVLSATGEPQCAYCGFSDPTPQHLEEHNHNACAGQSRLFSRKDHLVQHLRVLHRLKEIPPLDSWRRELLPFSCRCGFCSHQLNSWKERVEHLAGHFRKGYTMRDWQGEHEFPPSVAANVQNGIPPYLIDDESRAQQPFSASNSSTRDHYEQITTHTRDLNQAAMGGLGSAVSMEASAQPESSLGVDGSPPRTFSDILARHLSQFARLCLQRGELPTDEMFQLESRRVIYDCEDAWNQTIADNPTWLASFRRQFEDLQPGDQGY